MAEMQIDFQLPATASHDSPAEKTTQKRTRTRRGGGATNNSGVTCVNCSKKFPTKAKYNGHLSKCQAPKSTPNGALKKPEDAVQATPTKAAKKSNGRRVTFNETLEYAFITPEKSSDDERSSHASSSPSTENKDANGSSSEDSSSDSSSSSSSSDGSSRENTPSPVERAVPCLQCNDTFNTIYELETHKIQAHTNQFLFECPVCHEKSEVPTEVKEITCPHCKQISEAWLQDDEAPRADSETMGDSESAIEQETGSLSESLMASEIMTGPEVVVETEVECTTEPAAEGEAEMEAEAVAEPKEEAVAEREAEAAAESKTEAAAEPAEEVVTEPEIATVFEPEVEMKEEAEPKPEQVNKPDSTGRPELADLLSGSFSCPRCAQVFDNKISLRDHQIAIHPTFYSAYLCRHKACNSKFNTYEEYIRHLEHHQLKHTCQYCEKSFSLQTTLRQHIRIHTGERPFACDECGRSFAVKDYLTKHTRIHTGEKPYKCQKGCGAKFTQQSARKIHMMNSCPCKDLPPAKPGRPAAKSGRPAAKTGRPAAKRTRSQTRLRKRQPSKRASK